jgi:hypothetical protein
MPPVTLTAAQTALSVAAWASGVNVDVIGTSWASGTFTESPMLPARQAVQAVAIDAVGVSPGSLSTVFSWHTACGIVSDSARATQTAYLRDLFPPPRYVPRLDPRWRTTTVVALAKHAHESGDYSVVPILADGLQDGGCDDEVALRCCRVPGNVHVRGNWVVDLVLDRL